MYHKYRRRASRKLIERTISENWFSAKLKLRLPRLCSLIRTEFSSHVSRRAFSSSASLYALPCNNFQMCHSSSSARPQTTATRAKKTATFMALRPPHFTFIMKKIPPVSSHHYLYRVYRLYDNSQLNR